MRVYNQEGACVSESPSREGEAIAPVRQTALVEDSRNLAPISIELEAVRLYAESGSLASVSRSLGIAIYELQKLQRTTWWQAELAALRREESAMKNAKLTRIHDMTLSALEDRLEHGDLVMRGSGFVRVKLSARDLARVSEAVFKQRQLLLGEPTHIDGANKKLEELANKLRALGAKDASGLVIDMEPTNVHATLADTEFATAAAESREYATGDD